MKNFLAISILLSIVFLSCDKGKPSTESSSGVRSETANNAVSFFVDSINVKDSLKIDKNLNLTFISKILLFPSIKNKSLLDSIYAPKEIRLQEYSKVTLTEALTQNKNEFYEEQKESLKDFKPEFAQNWDNNSDMKLFSNQNGFLTIQYTGDGYTGGAHGYYFENYKVFDLENNKTLQLSDVVSDKKSELWNTILMDNFIQNDGDKGQVEMLLVKKIPLSNNFYFDDENLYFLYNQYEITAYAAGTVLIKIPFSDIKPLLTDAFKNRQNL